jgi:hypothetical protein
MIMPTIELTRGYVAVVDDEDADLTKFKWHTNVGCYAARRVGPRMNRRTVFMHQVILERILGHPLPAGLEPDHRDGTTLNNRRSNLRLATRGQNNTNRKTREHTSRYRGVSWDGHRQKWTAHIGTNNGQRNLGRFLSERDAAQAYNEAALAIHGEFARPNMIE